VSTPLLGSKLTPSGADCRLKVSLLAGRSESVAKLVTTSVASPWITLSGGTVSTGALFTLLTTTAKLRVSLNGGELLSATRTVITLVLGPCASVGVQVSTPLAGSTVAPASLWESSKKVKGVVEGSEAVAVLVTIRVVNSLIV